MNGRDADRGRAILRAAIEVFARKGYHGCRIADVAREAGVAYGLVYHYFKNKDELLRSVFDLAWGGFVARMEAVAKSDAPLGEKVHGVARVAFEAYKHDPRGVKVVILEIARSPAGARVDRTGAFTDVMRMAEEMFRAAQQKGELRPELDPRVCAALLYGAIEMGLTALVVGVFEHEEAAAERVQRQIAEALLGGILPPDASPELEWKTERSATRSATARRS